MISNRSYNLILENEGDGMLNGSRLREVRKAKGLTQGELGDLIGVGKSAICCYEKETRNQLFTRAYRVLKKTKTEKSYSSRLPLYDSGADYRALGAFCTAESG